MNGADIVVGVVAVLAAVLSFWFVDRMVARFGWPKAPSYAGAVAVVTGVTILAGYLSRA